MLSIARCIAAGREQGRGRAAILDSLSRIEGVYVPSYFEPQYGSKGQLTEIRPLNGRPARVRRTVVADLNAQPAIERPLVPLARIVHDRLGLELARGCTRGCRFCQAGVIYRPVRELAPERVMELAVDGIRNGGFDELALLSLSTGDYSCLAPLLVRLMDEFAARHISVSMPSMRVGTLTPEIMEQVKRVRKSGFTIAPEAGTDRLRRVINKGITEADLLKTVSTAFELGWKLIKLYFMFGLPMETREDIDAIPALTVRALRAAGGKGRTINVSIGTFVPKPHTPFQWEPQLDTDTAYDYIDRLKRAMPKGAKLKWNDPRNSFLEGVFSRGDRRLAPLIEKAWRAGARLDAWSEYFNLPRWQEAAVELGIDLNDYLRRRELDEVLPWDHIDCGLESDFQIRELAKAREEAYTPDCRVHGCQGCGLCDFKKVKPVVYDAAAARAEVPRSFGTRAVSQPQGAYHYRFTYEKRGLARFVGHLEFLQTLFRAVERAGLPVKFSRGFNPSPRISFSPALPLGMESLAEYFTAELQTPLSDLDGWLKRMNDEMPQGFNVLKIKLTGKGQPLKIVTDYRIVLPVEIVGDKIDKFLRVEKFPLSVIRKGRKKEIDARPLVREIEVLDTSVLALTMVSEISKAGIKPLEFVQALLGLNDNDTPVRAVKLAWREDDGNGY